MQFDPGSIFAGLLAGYIIHDIINRIFGGHGAPRFRARSYRPPTPEDRIDRASKMVSATPHWDQGTVSKGVEELKRFYRDEGVNIPTDAELKKEAERLLNAATQGETVVEQ